MKDSLDKIATSQGGGNLFGSGVGNASLLDKRFIPLLDESIEQTLDRSSHETRKRLILQRVAQLTETNVPKSVVGETGVTKFKPKSSDRFRLL